MSSNRLRIMKVDPRLFLDVIVALGSQHAAGKRVAENALPEDVCCVRAYVDDSPWPTICLVLESESFQPVGYGKEIPEMPSLIIGHCLACEERHVPHDGAMCKAHP